MYFSNKRAFFFRLLEQTKNLERMGCCTGKASKKDKKVITEPNEVKTENKTPSTQDVTKVEPQPIKDSQQVTAKSTTQPSVSESPTGTHSSTTSTSGSYTTSTGTDAATTDDSTMTSSTGTQSSGSESSGTQSSGSESSGTQSSGSESSRTQSTGSTSSQ
jgi:mucin-2